MHPEVILTGVDLKEEGAELLGERTVVEGAGEMTEEEPLEEAGLKHRQDHHRVLHLRQDHCEG